MRAITLHQPWAYLVITGHKAVETRKNGIKQPGPILIHSSLTDTPEGREVYRQAINQFRLQLPPWEELGFGKILGSVTITGTRETTLLKERLSEKSNLFLEHIRHSGAQELAFGDYTPGRKGWLLDNPTKYPEPIPTRGFQGIWQYHGPLPTLAQIFTPPKQPATP
jgi:hypothetical protein